MSWLVYWRFSVPVTLVAGGVGLLYLRGDKSMSIRSVAFWLGWASLFIGLQTRFDYYTGHAFYLHMLQHSFLQHTGPFLLALSRPGMAMRAGLPQRVRESVRTGMEAPGMRWLAACVNQPVIAALLFGGLTGFWLLPRFHDMILFEPRWYQAMNLSMAVDGLLFWNLALNNYAIRPAYLFFF